MAGRGFPNSNFSLENLNLHIGNKHRQLFSLKRQFMLFILWKCLPNIKWESPSSACQLFFSSKNSILWKMQRVLLTSWPHSSFLHLRYFSLRYVESIEIVYDYFPVADTEDWKAVYLKFWDLIKLVISTASSKTFSSETGLFSHCGVWGRGEQSGH